MTTPISPPQAEYRFAMIFWLVLLGSMGMYFVVIRQIPADQAVDNPAFVRILLIVATAFVVASFVARSRLEARASQQQSPRLRRAGFILAVVLCEATGPLATVVWVLTAWPYFYLFLLIGGVGLLLHFPRRPA